MKNKLIAILKATGIMVAIITATIIIGVLCCLSNYLYLPMVIIAIVYGIYYFYRMMRPKERYYFVSYFHGDGLGCCTVQVKGVFPITKTIRYISNTCFGGEANVVILYYKEISEEEYKCNQPCAK